MPSYAITGTSRGLGLEFVKQLAANPKNTVFAMARNPDKSLGLQALLKDHRNVVPVKLEITSAAEWKAAAETVSKTTGGKLDVLIHNAADVGLQTAMMSPYAVGDQVELLKSAIHAGLDVNVLSALDGTNAFVPLILAGQEKKIIAISSAMGLPELVVKAELPNTVPYAISKAALNLLMSKYAAELRPEGVKVLSVSPGWVRTQEESPESAQFEAFLLEKFRRVQPELQGQVTAEQSVRECLHTIESFGWDVNGTMVSSLGNQKWLST